MFPAALPTPRLAHAISATPQALAAALGVEAELLLPMAEASVRAGFPSPADDFRVRRIDLMAELVTNELATMLVRARGDSMRDAGIFDNDVLVVDKSISPKHGHIVVAMLDDDITVKRLFKRGRQVKLQPANPDFPEIIPKDGQVLTIWGVVTSSIKRFPV